MTQLLLMSHVAFGVGCLLAGAWVFVETLNATAANQRRIRIVSWIAMASMWIAFVIAGYWYVFFYKGEKSIILSGPWPSAHRFFMETKEHLVIPLLLLSTYLPIAVSHDLSLNRDARRLVLWVAGLISILALVADGEGGIIAMGVKMGLLWR